MTFKPVGPSLTGREAGPVMSAAILRALIGEASGAGPYTHTFTPTGWGSDLFDNPQTDAEWAFCDWWTENDAEEATAILRGPEPSFTFIAGTEETP